MLTDTGFPRADAENDFLRARRREVAGRVGYWLRRDPDRRQLLSLDRVVSALGRRGRGEALPPIEVYRVGACHFVEDGHHRVSIARATRQKTIDAYVTEVLTARPAAAAQACAPCAT